jgi:hypothetical protein
MLVGHSYLRICAPSSQRWRRRSRVGEKDKSPTSCLSNWVCSSIGVPLASTWSSVGGPRQPPGQRWASFVNNHAGYIVAFDFFTSVTATFPVLYVFVALEIGSRRTLYGNVTDHPIAEWTRQQFREFPDGESGHRYLIHDRDSVFSAEVDAALNGFGLKVLKTPVRSPMANAIVSG